MLLAHVPKPLSEVCGGLTWLVACRSLVIVAVMLQDEAHVQGDGTSAFLRQGVDVQPWSRRARDVPELQNEHVRASGSSDQLEHRQKSARYLGRSIWVVHVDSDERTWQPWESLRRNYLSHRASGNVHAYFEAKAHWECSQISHGQS
jgi:hypothetical protein